MFFTTGQGFLNTFQSEIVGAMLENHAEVRIIVGRKNSPFLNSVGMIEKKYKTRNLKRKINPEIKVVKDFIPDFRTRTEGHGKVELKHFETEFRTSMILIESHTEKWGLITLTTPPYKAVESVAFMVKDTKNKNTVYKQCRKHFDAVWKTLPAVKGKSQPANA